MKCLYKLSVIICLCISGVAVYGQQQDADDCDCDHIIGTDMLFVDGEDLEVEPGDVVCVMAGERRYLGLRNFKGAEGEPVTIVNCGGKVVVRNSDWHYGIRIDNSQFFRFTGTGDPYIEYGFHIAEASDDEIVGFNIGGMSSDMEIDHVEIENTGFAGLMTKTDPDCEGSPNRGNFVQRNTIIRNNYIHDTGGEGIYVGFPHYTGIVRDCDGEEVRVFPHDLEGVMIYDNQLESIKREGIQVGCAVANCNVYNNTIKGYGLKNEEWQNAGMHISTGTTGIFRNNFIKDGMGPGVWLNGKGDNLFYNNIIADPGTDGFLCHDSLVEEGTGYYIINNTITNCGRDGIHFLNEHTSTGNEFINNIIGGVKGDFYKVLNTGEFHETNNVTTPDQRLVYFKDPQANDYRLQPFSPGIDEGKDVSHRGIVDDFAYAPRPQGEAYDVGAFESEYERHSIDFMVYPVPATDYFHANFINYEDGYVGLNLYDELGRLVAVIHDGYIEAGVHDISTSVTVNLAAAVYFLELRRGDHVRVKRVVVIH
ncbi:right-handed parallel beta-helix repeat-containing protein [Cytophagaceae bacterium ABcell3]|nr:right-handed parallel beta-helix repeat-containing protein [Cytophagaceae bacterium ABcell3]